MDATITKCAGSSCSCPAPEGSKYCSPHCETSEKIAEISCNCGHAGCSGNLAK